FAVEDSGGFEDRDLGLGENREHECEKTKTGKNACTTGWNSPHSIPCAPAPSVPAGASSPAGGGSCRLSVHPLKQSRARTGCASLPGSGPKLGAAAAFVRPERPFRRSVRTSRAVCCGPGGPPTRRRRRLCRPRNKCCR